MKRILTLLLLFTITLFYIIPSEAYTLNGNDIPLVQTKNLFDSNNLELNSYDGFTGLKTTRNSTIRSIDKKPILPSTTYLFSMLTPVTNNVIFFYYDVNNVYLGVGSRTLLGAGTGGTFTTPSTAATYNIAIVNTLDTTSPSFSNNYQLELGSVATSYAPYGFLTLNEIFVDGQLLTNSDFDNGTTGWSVNNATQSVLNSINTLTTTSIPALGSQQNLFQNFTFSNNLKYFIIANVKATNATLRIFTNDLATINNNDRYKTYSNVWTSNQNELRSLGIRTTTNNNTILVDYLYLYNLNSLGIDHILKDDLDNLYKDWQLNNAFIEGYNEGYNEGYDVGYDVGYDEGYDDGVASDTSFAVGFALGLSQGADMETGSSLLILIVAVIGFVMMIFGFATKRGIFNLLSVAAFVVLGGLLVEFVGFIIITVGLVFINVYYAFFGDL